MDRTLRPSDLNLQQTTSATSNPPSNGSLENPQSQSPSSSSASATPSKSLNLLNVTPAPAYIASSAAARLVTGDHEAFFRSLRDDGAVGSTGTPTMFVSSGSLALVNQFLDFLLYSFLSNSRSTSLSGLRPAITDVLRIRLAREALAGADQELKSYLGGDDEDVETLDDAVVAEPTNEEWNLESTWRKCRVQCMVYSSLGDLEEDDEAFYTDNGGLEGTVGPDRYQRQNSNPCIVTPAVAIWLTSILEFIGEQTLLVAGHATIARYSTQRIAAASGTSSGATSSSSSSEVTFPEKPTVEELDTEKVALNPSLGRMWRQWRKKVRGGSAGGRRSFSASSREVVLNSPDARVAANTKNSPKNSPKIPGQEIAINESTSTQAGNTSPIVLSKSGVLGPIVEAATPATPFDTFKCPVPNNTNMNGYPTLRRPASLMTLPWTNSPPFVLRSAVKRQLSLPNLMRGDFADPIAEVLPTPKEEEEEEQPYMMIPLPQPGPEEEHELEDRTSEQRDYPADDELQQDEDDEISTCAPIPTMSANITHWQPTEDSGQEPIEVDDSQPPSVVVQAEEEEELASETTTEVLQAQPVRRIREEYDPYAIKPRTPTRPETFFTSEDDEDDEDEEEEDISPRRKPRMQPIYTGHNKSLHNHSSSSSGQSFSDRKIGQLHLVQSSASTHSIASDRGTGVRVFTPPATPDKSRRSSSFSKIQRPIHTSGSTSSQASILKSFLPWPHDGGKHTKMHESDGESHSSHHSDRLASLDDKQRSFEELISSGGTIHCTITPDPIRNMERDPSPRGTPTQELADFFRSTAPDGRPIGNQSSKSIPSSPRVTAQRSSPTSPAWGDYRQSDHHTTSSLSDFLKHAAPPGSPGHATQNSSKLQKMMTSGSTSSIPTSHLPSKNNGTNPGPSDTTGLPAVIRHQSHTETAGRSKNRLLARDASGSTGSDTTSALADFFRNTTPPVIADGGEQPAVHRIPRAVAPFRNTMDSTQFESVDDDDDIIEEADREHSPKPTASTVSAPQESYSSSFTSSTALLRSGSRKTREYGSSSTTTMATSSMVTSSAPEVKRKQFRSKDPYAIDSDDDDELDDMEGLNLVIPKKREEESLVDFLRNTPPPPPPTAPQPFVQSNGKTIQKKGSAVSLMSRFSRSGRKNSIASNADKMPFIPPPPTAASQASRHVPLMVPPVADARAGRNSSGSDQFARPTYGQARADFDGPFGAAGFPSARPSRPNVQARGARAGRNDTDSLADFLKHTGPPPEARVAQPQKEESRSLLQKISFSRHKKVGVS